MTILENAVTEHMDFRQRMTAQRPHGRGAVRPGDPIDQFESDRGRIINSAAVRRLQQKTQVFPLERNAAVRSRLTHSLEVQQTGRFIVRTLFKELGDNAAKYHLDDLDRPMESLVEMACLMHDVGNPPFGHFGEFAIKHWFESHLDDLFAARVPIGDANKALRSDMLVDLKHFEGNAQAIRLVVSLLRLNLTYTQTATLLKYVRPAWQPVPTDKQAAGYYLNKKPGFYLSEQPFIENLNRALGMKAGSRHPLAYVMEAADDISYCLADIEDSVEKGILDIGTLADLLMAAFAQRRSLDEELPGASFQKTFRKIIDYALQRSRDEPVNKVGEFFIWLRVSMIHPLVKHAAAQFIGNMEAVFDGTLDRALMEDDSLPHTIIETFKQVARERVFCNREVETLELQGYRIIGGLLDFYSPLLRLDSADFQALAKGHGSKNAPPHTRLLTHRIPSQHLKAYLESLNEERSKESPSLWEYYHRCRMLQDFVSGMTDQHAHDEYKALSVI